MAPYGGTTGTLRPIKRGAKEAKAHTRWPTKEARQSAHPARRIVPHRTHRKRYSERTGIAVG